MGKLAVWGFIVLVAVAGPAVAQNNASGTASQTQAHGHRSGIDKAAFMARAEKRFAAMDTNGDGIISPEERKAAKEKRQTEHSMRGH